MIRIRSAALCLLGLLVVPAIEGIDNDFIEGTYHKELHLDWGALRVFTVRGVGSGPVAGPAMPDCWEAGPGVFHAPIFAGDLQTMSWIDCAGWRFHLPWRPGLVVGLIHALVALLVLGPVLLALLLRRRRARPC